MKHMLLTLLLLSQVSVTFSKEKLPKGIKWVTNNSDPIFASPKAVKGGTFYNELATFPLTLRTIGPDSNGSFREHLNGNRMGLTVNHPNTNRPLPSLATHWAFHKDKKTIFFKLDKRARWSDGKPVTADDYLFTLDFYRSKDIVAPWYNNYYSEFFHKIVKYDDYTIGVFGKVAFAEDERMDSYGTVAPRPKHFYKTLKNFPQVYNWKIEPNSGAYQISKIRKGKYITWKRKKDWWANDMKYFKHRFNVDKIKMNLIREKEVRYAHFKKGKIDSFVLTFPDWWHNKAKGKVFDKGYVHKLWFYTGGPQSNCGMWLNMDKSILKDINVRKGIHHSTNIDKVIKTVLRGDYERLHTGDTGCGPYENKKLKARKFDLTKASYFFKKAGWTKRGSDGILTKNGKRLSVEIITGYATHRDRLVVVKEEAKKAGLEFKLKILDGATAWKSIQEKQHDIAWMCWGAGSVYPVYWEKVHSDNAHKPQTNNLSNLDDKKIDKLISKYKKMLNVKKKVRLSHKIQQRIYDLAGYIPTFAIPFIRTTYWRYWKLPKVPFTKTTQRGFDLFGLKFMGDTSGGLFWLDKKLKEETKKAMKSGKSFKPVTIIDKTFKSKR